jgi:CRP-like cAMP-binding protein
MIEIMPRGLPDLLSELGGREQRVAAGASLFRAGDPVLSLFLVTAGSMRLVRALPHGGQLTLQRAEAGAILAEASLFGDNYQCDAKSVEDSVLRGVPLWRVKAALEKTPELASALARNLAHQLQRSRAHAEILSLKTVAERLSAWQVLNGSALPPKGHWRQLASEIGVTPEALYRELASRRLHARMRQTRRQPAW